MRVLLLCLALLASVSAQGKSVFPSLLPGDFVDCNAPWDINLNQTQPTVMVSPDVVGSFMGKASFGGWQNRAVLPQGCRFVANATGPLMEGQRYAFRLNFLSLPWQVSLAASAFQWRFRIDTINAGVASSLVTLQSTTGSGTGNQFSASGWFTGNQMQWITPEVPAPPANGEPKSFAIVLEFKASINTVVPITEVTSASTAYFALDYVLTTDKCPGTNLYTPTKGAPFPRLEKCPMYNGVNASCCQKSDEDNLNDWSTDSVQNYGAFVSPTIQTYRYSACTAHYQNAKCGVFCSPKSADYWYRNFNASTPRNEFVLCKSYCTQVYSSCANERLLDGSVTNRMAGFTAIKVKDIYATPEAFCGVYFGNLNGAGTTFIRVGDVQGKCYDGPAAGASGLSISALVIALAFFILF